MEAAVEHGWRERKRRETARRITDAGFALFAANGYEATTLDAIAEASGIARRTFFHYFPSKEDILLAWQGGLPERFRAALLAVDPAHGPVRAVRDAHLALVAQHDADTTRLIDRIIRSSDRLLAANQAKYLMLELVGFETLCELWPDPARRDGLRMVAMAATGALRIALGTWVADGRGTLAEHIAAAFAALEQEFGAPTPA